MGSAGSRTEADVHNGVVPEDPQSFYDAVGGAETFHKIVSRFYELVRDDEVLRPLYPDDELDAAEDRLRMRHTPFRIGFIERDAWLRCMHTAIASIDAQTLDDEHRRELLAYLEMAAQSMVNSPF